MSQVNFSNADSLITAFAKQTKVSKTKLAEFVQTLQASAVIEGKTSSGAGRKVSDESIKIRNYICEHAKELAGKQMTVKEFSTIIGTDPATCTNNLRWLAENKKNVKMCGYAQKEAGKRGKVPALWSVISE